MEQKYNARDIIVRTSENLTGLQDLYISILTNYDEQMGIWTESVLTDSRTEPKFVDLDYLVIPNEDGYTFEYLDDEMSKRFGVAYDFETTVQRLLGKEISENQEFTLKSLQILNMELNRKMKEAYGAAYVVENATEKEYGDLKKGQIVLSRTEPTSTGDVFEEFMTPDRKVQVLYSYNDGSYFRRTADYDYKVIPPIAGVVKRIAISDIPGVKSTDRIAMEDLPFISIDVADELLKQKEAPAAAPENK